MSGTQYAADAEIYRAGAAVSTRRRAVLSAAPQAGVS